MATSAIKVTTSAFTSYSLRRLGPTLADSSFLLLHERLPLGCWKADGLPKAEREAARSAKMPLLYADSSTKEQVESLVKEAVWGMIDRLYIMSAGFDSDTLTWAALAPRMRYTMNRWRNATEEVKQMGRTGN